MPLEREVKLRFSSPADARAAVVGTGATLRTARRLQQDSLLDTEGGRLRASGCALRLRQEGTGALLTFKGPVEPSTTKVREEWETLVGDGAVLLRIAGELGFRVWFRYEKYREEFTAQDVVIAVDETPVGTFVEIEGSEDGIRIAAAALGRSEADYLLQSYRRVYLEACATSGRPAADMLFPDV
jgi:adenylate cyclase class 2